MTITNTMAYYAMASGLGTFYVGHTHIRQVFWIRFFQWAMVSGGRRQEGAKGADPLCFRDDANGSPGALAPRWSSCRRNWPHLDRRVRRLVRSPNLANRRRWFAALERSRTASSGRLQFIPRRVGDSWSSMSSSSCEFCDVRSVGSLEAVADALAREATCFAPSCLPVVALRTFVRTPLGTPSSESPPTRSSSGSASHASSPSSSGLHPLIPLFQPTL